MVPDPWTSIRAQEGMGARIRGTMGKSIDWGKYDGGKVEAL